MVHYIVSAKVLTNSPAFVAQVVEKKSGARAQGDLRALVRELRADERGGRLRHLRRHRRLSRGAAALYILPSLHLVSL